MDRHLNEHRLPMRVGLESIHLKDACHRALPCRRSDHVPHGYQQLSGNWYVGTMPLMHLLVDLCFSLLSGQTTLFGCFHFGRFSLTYSWLTFLLESIVQIHHTVNGLGMQDDAQVNALVLFILLRQNLSVNNFEDILSAFLVVYPPAPLTLVFLQDTVTVNLLRLWTS